MIAYVTSCGERTTGIAVEQLQRFGFNVILLDKVEPWLAKYERFIHKANTDCLRVDADIIVNKNIKKLEAYRIGDRHLMMQFQIYDFYQNAVHTGMPVYYTAEALKIIKERFHLLDPERPEASAWRLKEINSRTFSIPEVVGMHAFFNDMNHLEVARNNKIRRGQIEKYDFELAKKLLIL